MHMTLVCIYSVTTFHKINQQRLLYVFIRYSPGLIELPTPITFNEHIRPVQLSNTCGMPHLGGEDVVAAGMGRDEMDKKTERSDMRLRHANFVTKSSFFCSFQTNHRMDPNTIICANANHDTNQSVYKGDSGKFGSDRNMLESSISKKHLKQLVYPLLKQLLKKRIFL